MALYINHSYIHDAAYVRHAVLDENGTPIKLTELYERWKFKRAGARSRIDKLSSFDNGVVVGNITDMLVCPPNRKVMVTTSTGRKLWSTWDLQLYTEDGLRAVKNIGVGTKVLSYDRFKDYHGDKIAMDVTGNGKLRAFLRNNGVEFFILRDGGTLIEDMKFYVRDMDTLEPSINGNVHTLGLNNYREHVKKLFDLKDFTYDEVIRILEWNKFDNLIGVYMDQPQNMILANGFVVGSVQTPRRTNGKYEPSYA